MPFRRSHHTTLPRDAELYHRVERACSSTCLPMRCSQFCDDCFLRCFYSILRRRRAFGRMLDLQRDHRRFVIPGLHWMERCG